jgi:MraZ protein
VKPFVSTVTNKLDAKGRVSIPAPYRQILAEQGTQGVYCFRSFRHPALNAFGEATIAKFQSRLEAYDPFFSEDHDARAQAILAASQLLAFDDEGRVRLPDEFIAHAGLTERVTFVGLNDKFEIWDPDRLAPIARKRLEDARASMK